MKLSTMIVNPNSGKNKRELNEIKIKTIFKKYNYDVTIIYTKYKGHAKEITEKIETDLLISVGGDGTFNEVMVGNLNREKRLIISHIPHGTANDLGAMYGYKRSFYLNLELLLQGKVKKIDICTINNHPFTYVAAWGKGASISYETPSSLKKKFGYLAYLLGGVKEFNSPSIMQKVYYEVDGVKYSGEFSLILISNANHIAGINNFYNDIKLDDNRFEVLFCEHKSKIEMIQGLTALLGDISKANGFKFYRAHNLKIVFEENLKKGFSLDGEELLDKSNTFNIDIINGIDILIPKKNIKKLFVNVE